MFYKLTLLVIITLFGVNASANLLNDVNTFSATFKQNITNSSNNTIVYEGEIFIKESEINKILWRYKTPIIKNVYIINRDITIDEPQLEQVTYTYLSSEISMFNILKSSKEVSNNTYKTIIEGVEYTIVEKEKLLEISYSDTLENKITIYFENIKKNEEIEDTIFQFNPPTNYDILMQ